jgi:uncharacterized protein YndB with AHSA1/START domain
MDFRVGGTSLVSMRAPKDFGGQDFYNIWVYQQIIPLQRIEFIQNLSDADGNLIDPGSVGMPPDFPRDTRTVITFKALDDGRTEMTVTEYGLPPANTPMGRNAELGLQQTIEKMAAALGK